MLNYGTTFTVLWCTVLLRTLTVYDLLFGHCCSLLIPSLLDLLQEWCNLECCRQHHCYDQLQVKVTWINLALISSNLMHGGAHGDSR